MNRDSCVRPGWLTNPSWKGVAKIMKDRMDAIWEKVREKQTLESAAYWLLDRRRTMLTLKLSISVICGLLIVLLPAAGAAKAFAELYKT